MTTVTYTSPIKYSNQDFDEYQAAIAHLGWDHVEWYCGQPKCRRQSRINGAWTANATDNLVAYQCVERYRFNDHSAVTIPS